VIVTDTLLLNFHGIGRPHKEITEAELSFWLTTEKFISWTENSNSASSEFALTIVPTFDDGNSSDLEIVAPALAKYGTRGLFFPCVGRIGRKHYLDKSDIRALAKMGHEIGTHGVNHVPWTSLDPKALHREINYSRQCLENILGVKVDSVAIPFGAYNRRVLSALQKAAFSRIYTTDKAIVRGSPMMINRYSIRRDDDPEDLGKIIKQLSSHKFRLISNVKTMIKSLR
jgi:peptidoglycan/xylan/chitin deacetylase (PgdA/CDA1 family)